MGRLSSNVRPHRETPLLPELAISYQHPAEEGDFVEFRAKLAPGGTDVIIERREEDGPHAGLE